MRKTIIALSILASVLALAGCEKNASAPGADGVTGTGNDSAKHAHASVQPGSHEDWCGEHAVAESQCTLCNPSLIAAFKATGDWCEEHGLPESHCRTCNPDLKIERPPKKGA